MATIGTKTKNILIVEDNLDMQEMYRIFFNGSEKYKIDIEGDAEQALKRAREKSYDLIVLDIIMDPMSGDSLFVYLRQDEKTKNIPVLIVSVLSTETLENLREQGNVDCLGKPITREQLFKKIEKMVG